MVVPGLNEVVQGSTCATSSRPRVSACSSFSCFPDEPRKMRGFSIRPPSGKDNVFSERRAGPALVGGGDDERRDLCDVDVVEQADPHDAGQDVKPAREREFVEARTRDDDDHDDREDAAAAGDRGGDRIERIHGVVVMGSPLNVRPLNYRRESRQDIQPVESSVNEKGGLLCSALLVACHSHILRKCTQVFRGRNTVRIDRACAVSVLLVW